MGKSEDGLERQCRDSHIVKKTESTSLILRQVLSVYIVEQIEL